jgi:hypothetical protein
MVFITRHVISIPNLALLISFSFSGVQVEKSLARELEASMRSTHVAFRRTAGAMTGAMMEWRDGALVLNFTVIYSEGIKWKCGEIASYMLPILAKFGYEPRSTVEHLERKVIDFDG